MPHRNIPVFIPQIGCPHVCVFCDRRAVSTGERFDESALRPFLENALATIPENDPPEIAYFGGSFTGIERGLMIRLLDLAADYVRQGRVSGIRLSTRPDLIDGEVLDILGRYPISAVELGIQSMDDRVLAASGRGHTAERSAIACAAVREAGFALVGQIMPGLPASTPQSDRETAERVCALDVSACRIYPTVVFRGTVLAEMTVKGSYRPMSLEEAVERSADVLEIFRSHGVPCLRIGLHATEALTSPDSVLAGPNHPALGELVLGELYYRELISACRKGNLTGRRIRLTVPRGEASRAVGQNRKNLIRLLKETGTVVTRVREAAINGMTVEEDHQ